MQKALRRPGKPALAYVHTPGNGDLPAAVFMAGFRSDMEGTKALYLEAQCKARGQEFVRFDYSGHGASEGAFEGGTIGIWAEDALAILDDVLNKKPCVVVGSSMGGWIAFLCALQRPGQVRGLVGIAAAPDFTRKMYARSMTDAQRAEMDAQGYIEVENDYSDEPYKITKALMEDGESQCLLEGGIALSIPIRLVQGMKDTDVEWQHAHRIKNAIAPGGDVDVILIEEGDHRLSRPEDLEIIDKCLLNVSG